MGAACEQAGVSYDDVEAALAQVGASREAHHEADAATMWDLDLLVAYIEKTHHRHVHLENNVLFPGAARLLKRRFPEHAGAEQPA